MLKDWFLYNNKFCAVEHTFDAQGADVFNYLLLAKKGKELLIVGKEVFDNKEALVNFLKEQKQNHVVLVVNDQQVLSKKITSEVATVNQNVFQVAYPNLNSQEFQYQYEITKEHVFLAVTRNSYIQELINFYQTHKISVLDFSLGNIGFFKISKLFKNQEVNTSNAHITLASDEVTNITLKQFDKENYTLNGLAIESNDVLLLGGIVGCYIEKGISKNRKLFEAFKDAVIFKKGVKIALSLCFLVLLINFMVFSSYHSKVNRLNSHIELYRSTTEELNALNKKVKKKENLLNQIQNYASKSTSKYIDELVARLPNTVLLTELNYQPFLNTIKEEKEIENENGVIKVSGEFKEQKTISIWVDSLEKLPWVKEVSKLSIENTSKKSKFYFSIVIKDEL